MAKCRGGLAEEAGAVAALGEGRPVKETNKNLVVSQAEAAQRLGVSTVSLGKAKAVLAQNVARRHLHTGQKALIAARLANLEWGQTKARRGRDFNKNVSIPDAAGRLGIGMSAVHQAKAVLARGAPALVRAVERDILPVSVAALRPMLTSLENLRLWVEAESSKWEKIAGGQGGGDKQTTSETESL